MHRLNRRDFIKASSMAAVSGPILTTSSAKNSPNDTINVAVVGVGRRGRSHCVQFAKMPNIRLATLCDVDERVFPQVLKTIPTLVDKKVKTEVDIRRVLDDKEVDAISIATPDHWHALATIWACQAGKDVLVEKPSCHNIWEGRKMIEAARKYNRIVQVGLHNRSNPSVKAAIHFMREGGIGDVYMAKGLCFKARDGIGKTPTEPIPSGVHYDLWLGPAPKCPFTQNRFHYNWHWFWDYGCADLGNQGVHEMDVARWGLGVKAYPVKIKCVGGRYGFDDDQQTPNTQVATMEFSDGRTLLFEVRGLYTNTESGMTIGNCFYGTKGWLQVADGKWQAYLGRNNEPGPGMASAFTRIGAGDGYHFQNFIDAIRSRNSKELNSHIEEGHLSTAFCHLCNISYRVGREVKFDGESERFVGDEKANALLTREYRKPFIVPPIV